MYKLKITDDNVDMKENLGYLRKLINYFNAKNNTDYRIINRKILKGRNKQ